MKKMKIVGITVFIISIFILNASTLSVNAYDYDSSDLRIKIVTDDAYYCDADSDGAEDDVVIEFTLDIDINNWKDINFYKLEADLELPSGIDYRYNFYLNDKPSKQSVLFMYNHATEPGWYIIEMQCTLYADGDRVRDTDSLIFDPPKGIGGTEPLSRVLYI